MLLLGPVSSASEQAIFSGQMLPIVPLRNSKWSIGPHRGVFKRWFPTPNGLSNRGRRLSIGFPCGVAVGAHVFNKRGQHRTFRGCLFHFEHMPVMGQGRNSGLNLSIRYLATAPKALGCEESCPKKLFGLRSKRDTEAVGRKPWTRLVPLLSLLDGRHIHQLTWGSEP